MPKWEGRREAGYKDFAYGTSDPDTSTMECPIVQIGDPKGYTIEPAATPAPDPEPKETLRPWKPPGRKA